MKLSRLNKLFLALLHVSLLSFVTLPTRAQDTNLTANYQWKPVKIGAGGWMRGLAVAPTGTAAYARGDVDEVYRWSSSAGQWYPTKIFGAIPSTYTGAPVNAGGGAIAIDPSNSNHVLVVFTLSGSADLGNTWGLNVFYSTDGALTYKAANLNLSGALQSETTGERLVIDPNNGNVAYLGPPGAGTGNGNPDGLQISLDGGATWAQVAGTGLPVSTASLRYEFQLPRIDGGSGTTTNGGQTASKIVYVTYIKHDETNNDNVIGGGVLKSADGGNTWTDITGTVLETGTSTVGFATIDTLGNLWIADAGNNNLYKWTRGGSTWTTSYPNHGGGGGIAVDPSNPQRIFAQGNSAISRSLNGGTTWTDLGSMQFASDQTISWLDPSSYRPQGHYVSVSGLYFDASGTLWVAGANDGIMTYTPSNSDTSTTWISNSEGIEEAVAQQSVIPPGANPVLTVLDETMFTITDPDTYTAQHFPLNLWNNNNGLSDATDSSYAPNQPKYVVELSTNLAAGNPLVQSSEYSGYSADGGTTWQVFPSIANGTHPCLLYGGSIAVSARAAGHENDAPGADNLVWIPTNANNYSVFLHVPAPFYSTDGGATWTQTTSFNTAPGAISVTSPCSSGPSSYTYMGFLWGPWIYALTQHLLVADSVTPGTFYVDLTAGGFWKSTDGGVTWTQESATNAPGYPHHGTMAAVPGVSGDLWMVDGHEGGTAHGLFHTLDGGNTFTRSSVFDYAWVLALGKTAPGKSYPAIYVDGLYHGDPNWGIFQSIDGGVTFNRIANYPYGILDIPNAMTASWDVFGEVYIGFEGNTFYYAVYNDTTDPLTPPTLSATAGLNVVNLSWEPGAGGTPTGYNLYRGTASGQESTTPIATFDGSTFAYADTNVTDGTTYYYTLEATSTNGQSPVTSNEVSATPLIPLPGAPTGLTASIGGPSQINLTWIAPSGTVTSYNIYRSTTSGGEGTVPLQSGVTALTFADTSVLPGVQYYYTVAAVNSTGVGAQSAEATIALTQAAIPTFSPGSTSFTGTQSVSIATTTVNAGIIYTTDGSTPSTTHGSKYSGPITLTNTTTINAIAYGAGYTTSAVGTATYTLIVLEPAIVLTAVAASNSEIDLSWSIPAGVTVPAYYVFRGTSAGGESATPLATVTAATTYQDKSVSSGATYYYIVTAVNGAVPNSNEASATATQPALSFASGSGNTTASVTAGDTAVFNLTLDSTNYTGTVTYTCTGAPAGDVCSVVPAPLNLTPATTTSQVVITVKTAAKTAMLESQSTVYLSMVTWTGLLLSLPLWIKRRRLGMIAILLLTSGVLFAVSGCGSSTKPAATTSTLTLTAIGTGGVAPASATLTLTVQQPNTF